MLNKQYQQKIVTRVLSKKGFKHIREEAQSLCQTHSVEESLRYATVFYEHKENYVQELAVFIMGNCAAQSLETLAFLKNEVSQNDNWEVQEILAMAFDKYCSDCGYEQSVLVIKEWLESEQENVRRAVTEGLRIWTSRPYFKENPQEAVALLAALKNDSSLYVRKSVGNALRDISKKHPELIRIELSTWNLAEKRVNQVHKLAARFLN